MGLIYGEVHVLCFQYLKSKRAYFIEQLNKFFRKNYSDLFCDYEKIYGFSDEKQKLLIEFLIKFELDYIVDFELYNGKMN